MPFHSPVTAAPPEQALTILKNLPDAVFWRIWVVYRGNLPEDRYYTSGGLYEAPDQPDQMDAWAEKSKWLAA